MTRFIITIKAVILILAVAGQAKAADGKPTLYLVSVGVSKFEFKPFERGVQFAAKDARDVAELYQKQEGKLFGKVVIRLLTDDQATRANIEKALAWLAIKATKDTQVVVFFAGHGGPDPLGKYEFFPHDAHPVLPSTHVPGALVRDALHKVAGHRLLMLDTCFAGGFAGKDADFITLASCSATETSAEMLSTQNGYFTNVLLNGLSGKADINKDGVVTLAEVTSYIKGNLGNLTAGKQQLTTYGASIHLVSRPLVQATSTPAPGIAKGR